MGGISSAFFCFDWQRAPLQSLILGLHWSTLLYVPESHLAPAPLANEGTCWGPAPHSALIPLLLLLPPRWSQGRREEGGVLFFFFEQIPKKRNFGNNIVVPTKMKGHCLFKCTLHPLWNRDVQCFIIQNRPKIKSRCLKEDSVPLQVLFLP